MQAKEPQACLYTIGHSTRTVEEFIGLLKGFNIALIVDVRTVPHSKYNPQFNKENIQSILKTEAIKYIHMPEIGGLRKTKPNSENLALKDSLRGYADYMQTKEFTEGLLKLIGLAKENRLAVMCAEALPYACHRIILSDALMVHNVKVEHILGTNSVVNHALNEAAQVEGTKITYPLYSKLNPQRTLGDFGS